MKLQFFLKKVRVRIIHLEEKKNKVNNFITRVKIIFKLVNKNDDYDLNYSSRIQSFNAELKNVKFFLNDFFEAPLSLLTDYVVESSSSKKKDKNKKNDESS